MIGNDGVVMTEKQKRIADLKRSLLAPLEKKSNGQKVQMRKPDDDDPMKNKFKRVMDWGTPRIVTKNRTLVFD